MYEEIFPVSHLERFIAGQEPAISHLEQIIAKYGTGGSGSSGGSGSGGSGTTNYNALLNKPSINGVTLTGNKSLTDLGIDLSKYTTTDKAITSIELVDAIPTGSTGTTTEKCLRLTFADGTTVVNVSVNDLVGSDEKQKTIVCVVDDDGTNRTSDAYTGMITWLKDKGIPMNFAICHDTIGTSGKYTVTELQDLQAKGNDILIHGNPKLVNLTSENDVISEIESALQFHTSNGLKPTNIYVYPQGLNSDGTLAAKQVKEIVGRYFDYALNVNIASMSGEDTKGLWNKVPLVDKLNIARMEVSSTKGFDANKSKIDACIENKGLLILFTHSFMSQFTSGGYDEFKKIINYLSTQDVEFLTVSKALDKVEKIVKNYDDTQVKADIAKNKSDIADLDTTKQDKTDNTLDTTDKTVVGAINEINGNALDNATDLTKHTSDTNIHVTTSDKTKWNEVDNKIDKTDITTTIDSSSTDTQVPSARAVYNNINKDNNMKTYTSVEQLGLTTPTTVGDIYNSLPNNSCLNIVASHPSIKGVPSLSPTQSGLLSITKINTDAYDIIFKPNANGILSDNIMYIGQLKGTDGSNLKWRRLCTWDDTDIHITSDERTKWNNVDNKIDKTSIVTSIDSSSTDEQVVGAKAVYDNSLTKGIGEGNTIIPDGADLNNYLTPGVYTCFSSVSAETLLNCPHKQSNFKLFVNKNTGETTGFYGYQMIVGSEFSTIFKPCVYYRSVSGDKSNPTYSKWQKVCITSVADVPVTDIVPADTTTFVNFAGNCNYCVKNGICYVTIWGVQITSTGASKQTGVILPKSVNGRVGAIMAGVGDGMCHAFAYILEDGNLFFDVKDANINLYASFSYPVMEG